MATQILQMQLPPYHCYFHHNNTMWKKFLVNKKLSKCQKFHPHCRISTMSLLWNHMWLYTSWILSAKWMIYHFLRTEWTDEIHPHINTSLKNKSTPFLQQEKCISMTHNKLIITPISDFCHCLFHS